MLAGQMGRVHNLRRDTEVHALQIAHLQSIITVTSGKKSVLDRPLPYLLVQHDDVLREVGIQLQHALPVAGGLRINGLTYRTS